MENKIIKFKLLSYDKKKDIIFVMLKSLIKKKAKYNNLFLKIKNNKYVVDEKELYSVYRELLIYAENNLNFIKNANIKKMSIINDKVTNIKNKENREKDFKDCENLLNTIIEL